MKPGIRTALMASLALGAMAIVPQAAMAKKKPAEAAPAAQQSGPKLNLSKEFYAKLAPVDQAYKAKDWASMITGLDAVDAQTTSPDEKYRVAEYRLQAGIALANAAQQKKAIDALLGTGLIPADQLGRYQFFGGKFAYENKEYTRAETLLKSAASAGFSNEPDLFATLSRLYADTKRPVDSSQALMKGVELLKAQGKPIPPAYFTFGLQQAYNGKSMPEYLKWTTGYLAASPSPTAWHDSLANFMGLARNLSADKRGLGRAEIDVYRLMRATKSLAGEDDYYSYADRTNAAGNQIEAMAVVDASKAANGGSLSPDLMVIQSKASARAAELRKRLNSIESTDGPEFAAETYMGTGDYATAATLYQKAIAKGGLRDPQATQLRLGEALALSGQKDAAAAAFRSVTGTYANIATYWLLYLSLPQS